LCVTLCISDSLVCGQSCGLTDCIAGCQHDEHYQCGKYTKPARGVPAPQPMAPAAPVPAPAATTPAATPTPAAPSPATP
jgi:hypothetical protein